VTIVVIGATGGIGRALCEMLVQRGQSVLGVARSESDLQTLADELSVQVMAADVRDPATIESAFARASESAPVTGAVCLTGSILLKNAQQTSAEEFRETLEINLTAAFTVLRSAQKVMRSGSIVLMSSAAAQVGLPSHEAISAAKAGVEGMVRSAAASLASRGLRVNAVAPGLVRTKLAEKITSSEAALKASQAMHPLGRIGEAQEVAGVIDWLLSDAASWVTGQCIAIDGGLSRVRARGV